MPQSAAAYSARLYDAIEVAARAHHGQVRKGTEVPYLVHPLAVAAILIRARCPEHMVIAGILHDTLEDTPLTAAEIGSRFGPRIMDLVIGLTEPDKRQPWEKRKFHTIELLADAADEELLLVALADKLDNIRAIRQGLAEAGQDYWRRFNRPKEDQAGYYRSLARVFSARLQTDPGRSLAADFESETAAVFAAGPP
ncbi:MAG: HD domain-containing protein [Desulfobacterales bacterium]|jgi:(p)ppGpp synthase/HD superfamily hydrolase|nr:HD domain-containing protein [Desulfobacterales bacterium]